VKAKINLASAKIMFDAPSKVADVMREFQFDWFVAGGWAIDLFLDEETRPHDDIEIAVFRQDQLALQNHLRGWHLQKIVNRELVNWEKGEFLQLPIHEIHCFSEESDLSRLEVLLNEREGDEDWIYRRNQKITRPLSKLYSESKSGVKFLRPEIVLLYKSKNPRMKDEQDFRAVSDKLDAESKKWLRDVVSICYSDHHWLQSF
jgi:hypothetical protein